MALQKIQQLLEAGVHFGHQTRRWNPKMRRFIFAERNGIYIIDLQKTLAQLRLAQDLVRDVVARGDSVLFVTTKRQIRRLKELETGIADGSFEFFTKKEQLLLSREKTKLERNMSGLKNM